MKALWDAIWIGIGAATMAPGTASPYGRIEDAAIAVDHGRIAWIGDRNRLPGRPEALAKMVYEGEGA